MRIIIYKGPTVTILHEVPYITSILCKMLGSTNKKHLRSRTRVTRGLGQYNSQGEYCGPHTVSSVFLILACFLQRVISWHNIQKKRMQTSK